MRQVNVKVQQDYLERLAAARRPIDAIAELVWNSLDADASQVKITIVENTLGGIDEVRVEDDGNGMVFDDAVVSFENLGGSLKLERTRTTRFGRSIHGKRGRGRFAAFAIGSHVEWKTTSRSNAKLIRFTVSGDRTTLGLFTLSDVEVNNGRQQWNPSVSNRNRKGIPFRWNHPRPFPNLQRFSAYI